MKRRLSILFILMAATVITALAHSSPVLRCELDRTHGLDWYDFGARMHDAMLTRWGTIDPFAKKYYNFSPYIYCAANPIKFIDPTGKTISAIINENLYYIRQDTNGIYQMYDQNNTIYTPKPDSYGEYLLSDINKIASEKYGNELLSFLEKNLNNITIESSNDGFYSNILNNTIGYDETSTEGGLSYFFTSGYGTSRPQFIALAHEFAHIEDSWRGTFDWSTWYTNKNNTIITAEKYAMFKENQIRAEHHQPLRMFYEHITMRGKNVNLYIPILASEVCLTTSNVLYLLKNFSR